MPGLQALGLDWFSYTRPSVGKILRLRSSCDDEDTSKDSPEKSPFGISEVNLNQQENDAIQSALDEINANVRHSSMLNKNNNGGGMTSIYDNPKSSRRGGMETLSSVSRVRENVVPKKKNNSLIPSLTRGSIRGNVKN